MVYPAVSTRCFTSRPRRSRLITSTTARVRQVPQRILLLSEFLNSFPQLGEQSFQAIDLRLEVVDFFFQSFVLFEKTMDGEKLPHECLHDCCDVDVLGNLMVYSSQCPRTADAVPLGTQHNLYACLVLAPQRGSSL